MLIALLLAFGLTDAAVVPSPSPSAASATAPSAGGRDARKASVAPPTKGERKYINGFLGSIDPETGTVRFVEESGRTLTWPVDKKLAAASPALAAQMAKAFQPGDPVLVVYQEDTGAPTIIGLYRGGNQKKREQEGAAK